jgi:hypothetical protein
MAKTHVCVVSERLIPNLIPVLMLRPERVLLVSSAEMEVLGMTDRLRDVLGSLGFPVAVTDGLPSGALSRITAFARALLEKVGGSCALEDVVLNLTGGNKLMTLAFAQVWGPAVGKMIYTDTAHGSLEELPRPGDAGGASRPLESVLDVPLYLAAQGMRVRGSLSDEAAWEEGVQARRELTRYLATHAGPLGGLIGAVNALASRALDDRGEALIDPVQHFRDRPRGRWAEAVRRIEEAGLARWDRGTALALADLQAARYLNGGWLEESAWLVARGLRPDDVRLGVVGDWEGTRRGTNELDLVVVHSNRLLLVECKTLRMGWDMQGDRDLLYKLDSVGDDLRGLFGEVVLLSARDPSVLIRDRAAHHRIQVVGPDRLASLQRDIRDWMERGEFPSA